MKKLSFLSLFLLFTFVFIHAQAPKLFVQAGFMGPLEVAQYSPDGQLLAVSDRDKVLVWDVRSGKAIKFLEIPLSSNSTYRPSILNLAISPDRKYIAATHVGSTRTSNPTDASRFKVPITSHNPGKTVSIWDLEKEEVFEITAEGNVKSLAFPYSSNIIAFGTGKNKISYYDLTTKTLLQETEKQKGSINSIVFTKDWVAGATGKEVKIWDAKTLKELGTLKGADNKRIDHISIDASGKQLISGSNNGVLVIWDLEKRSPIHSFRVPKEKIIKAFFSPNDSYALGLSKYGVLKIWDLKSKKLIKEINNAGPNSLLTVNHTGRYIAFLPENNLPEGASTSPTTQFNLGKHALTKGKDIGINIFEGRNFEQVKTLRFQGPVKTRYMAFNKQGSRIATLTEDRLVKIWDLGETKLAHAINIPDEYSGDFQAKISPDFKYIAVADSSQMGIYLFEKNGKYGFHEKLDHINTWGPGERRFIQSADLRYVGNIGRDGHFYYWKFPKNGEELKNNRGMERIPNSKTSHHMMAFSAKGDYLMIARQRAFTIRNLNTNNYVFGKSYDYKPFMPESGNTSTIADLIPAEDGVHFYVQYAVLPDSVKEADITQLGSVLDNLSSRKMATFLVDGSTGSMRRREASLLKLQTTSFTSDVRNKDLTANEEYIFTLMDNWNCAIAPEKQVTVVGFDTDVMTTQTNPDAPKFREKVDRFTYNTENAGGGYFTSNTTAVNPTGTTFAMTVPDGSIQVFNLKTKQKILDIISKGEAYVMVTPDNYYKTERAGTELIGFTQGANVYPFDEMDLYFNRPDKVIASLSDPKSGIVPLNEELELKIKSYEAAHAKRIQRMGLTDDEFDPNHPRPQIEIEKYDQIPLHTQESMLNLKITATDPNQRSLKAVKVWVNTIPIFGRNGKPISPNIEGKFELSIPLSYGKNSIKISVVNELEQESIRAQIPNLAFDANPVKKPDLHIVSVGVSSFADKSMNLRYAAKDAQDILKAFLKKKNTYSNVKTYSLQDEKVSKESVMALRSELEKSTVDDKVIFFIASHGVLDKNLDYYLATHDMDFSDPANRGLSYTDLEDLMDGIPARQRVMLIDACHSGEVDKDNIQVVEEDMAAGSGDITFRASFGTKVENKKVGLENSFSLMQSLFEDIKENSGTKVISAAGGAEFAMEGGDFKNGIFTYALINTLTTWEADVNKNGNITVNELQVYLRDKVKELTQGNQTPTSRVENFQFDWNIW